MDKKKQAIQLEVDTGFLYDVLAKNESDPEIARIFRDMSAIEFGHAKAFLAHMGLPESDIPKPSFRAKTLEWLGQKIGFEFVLSILLDTEKGISQRLVFARKSIGDKATVSDTSHVQVLQNLVTRANVTAAQVARFEKRHRTIGGNALRAAVMGGNDGLVSNFSLVMGIAGATGGNGVLISGLAGLLAGALSMALGEWLSVKSSQELYEHQIAIEKEELAVNPEGELRELILIYRSKGIDEAEAITLAERTFANPETAHQMLIQEELGIQGTDRADSAMEAAITSFCLFAVGAIIPVFPFFFWTGTTGILWSVGCSAIGLFAIGSAITLFTGKPIWLSGSRQVMFGIMAAAITFGIGHLLGVTIGA